MYNSKSRIIIFEEKSVCLVSDIADYKHTHTHIYTTEAASATENCASQDCCNVECP